MVPLSAFFLFLWFRKRIKLFAIPKKFFLALAIAFYSFHPTILSNLVTLNICQQFDFGLYLQNYLKENCNSERYISFMHYFVIPLLLLVGVVLPTAVLCFLFVNKKKIYGKNTNQNFGFLIAGYKKTKYYW